MGFADYLKEELMLRERMRKEDPGGRQALLWLGAEMRAKDPQVFVKELDRRYLRQRRFHRTPVIDDLRFENELEWAYSRGLFRIRIEAPRDERLRRLKLTGGEVVIVDSDSLSETALDEQGHRFHQWVWNPHPMLGVCLTCESRKSVTAAADVYLLQQEEEEEAAA